MVRKPIAIPAGVDVKIDGNAGHRQGPQGHSDPAPSHPDMTVEVEDGEVIVTRPNDDKEHRALHGLTRTLIAQHGRGRDQRLQEGAGRQRRRLPCCQAGQEPGHEPGLSPIRSSCPRLTASPSTSPLPTRSSFTAPTSRRSASLPRKSARSVRPSRTRARASSTSDEVIRRKEGKAGKGKK